jgi:hypothetical protein
VSHQYDFMAHSLTIAAHKHAVSTDFWCLRALSSEVILRGSQPTDLKSAWLVQGRRRRCLGWRSASFCRLAFDAVEPRACRQKCAWSTLWLSTQVRTTLKTRPPPVV